jgi:hypothetical protein
MSVATESRRAAVIAAIKQVAEHESIRRDAHAHVNSEPGDVSRQGDVYIVRLDVAPTEQGPYEGNKLAPGDTQGSRHYAEGEGLRLYTPDPASATEIINRLCPITRGRPLIFGPTIIAPNGWTEVHPEHGHRTFRAGVDQAVYQRAMADEVKRVLD